MAETETALAVVTSIDDPAKGGAVKVAMPDIGGDEYPEWVEPIHPPFIYFHPQVGDTVEVSRPAGDDITEHSDEVRSEGVLTSEPETYPDELKENYPHRRGIVTPGGFRILIDDKEKWVSIRTPDRMVITLKSSGIYFGTEGASEPFVLGALWKAMMDTVLGAIAAHTHPTGVGPSGPPDNASTYTTEAAKTAAAISDFIFGQKAKP